MAELIANRENRIKVLKELITDLHRGKRVEEVKRRFEEQMKDVSPEEISAMEQALIQDGTPVEEVQRLCDVHAAVFRDALEKRTEPSAVPGHPVHTFIRENQAILELIDNEILPGMAKLKDATRAQEEQAALDLLARVNLLFDVDKHYERKEELLFPYLEKYGLSGPTQVMWGVDDEIRAGLKELKALLVAYDPSRKDELLRKVEGLTQQVKDMVFKEERILLPMAAQHLTEDEWHKIYLAQDEIGYCLVEPTAKWVPERVSLQGQGPAAAEGQGAPGMVKFATGVLSPRQIELILNHLPVDVTFVDQDDVVRYFSNARERIFARPRTILGRKVQNCHPPASVRVVESILKSFKEGTRDVAEFWIDIKGKFVYIRYFAVREENGEYVGTLEVTQEVSGIKALQGEKRLL